MIEETPRVYETSIDEIPNNDEFAAKESANAPLSENVQSGEAHVNYFFGELLICSILLWSLLFITNWDQGRSIIHYVGQVLDQQCSIEVVQDFVSELEKNIKTIL